MRIILTALLIFSCGHSFAEQKITKKDVCKFQVLKDNKIKFDDLKKLAEKTSNNICTELLLNNDLTTQGMNSKIYSEEVKIRVDTFFKEAKPFFESTFKQEWLDNNSKLTLNNYYDTVHALSMGDDIKTNMEKLDESKSDVQEHQAVKLYYIDPQKYSFIITDPADDENRKNCAKSEMMLKPEVNYCYDLAVSFNDTFNLYLSSINQGMTKSNEVKITSIRSSWDLYAKEARSLTLLDTMFTSWIHNDYYKQDHFVGPAATQYFALRPSLVYEHISDKNNGDRDEEAIAIELIGINWWNLEYPIGVSVAALYSDRSNVKSVSPSLMFHINNQYSLGYTFRSDEDGGNGIFLSVDFMKLFGDEVSGTDIAKKYLIKK
jgi:hypothetical protein